jgi:hypothetical protein
MTPAEKQAVQFADEVKKLIPDLSVPVWDAATCKAKGYGHAAAGVVLEETPFSAVDELTVESVDGYGYFKLPGLVRLKSYHAEPYASYLLLWYKD